MKNSYIVTSDSETKESVERILNNINVESQPPTDEMTPERVREIAEHNYKAVQQMKTHLKAALTEAVDSKKRVALVETFCSTVLAWPIPAQKEVGVVAAICQQLAEVIIRIINERSLQPAKDLLEAPRN